MSQRRFRKSAFRAAAAMFRAINLYFSISSSGLPADASQNRDL